MFLVINGEDISKYIAARGIKWQRSDVDGDGAGRMLDGDMVRNRVAIKRRLDVTCRPLKLSESPIVLALIEPEFVEVTFLDPRVGGEVTTKMYSNNVPATFLYTDRQGNDWWEGITFPLIEK